MSRSGAPQASPALSSFLCRLDGFCSDFSADRVPPLPASIQSVSSKDRKALLAALERDGFLPLGRAPQLSGGFAPALLLEDRLWPEIAPWLCSATLGRLNLADGVAHFEARVWTEWYRVPAPPLGLGRQVFYLPGD